MSNPIKEMVAASQSRFMEFNVENRVTWEQESGFAAQQLMKNEYSLKAAQSNPIALQAAIVNVAAIGLSLNPASSHAYLVPRDGQICLDISYRGLVKLATESGAIKDCKAELVYENDKFTWRGPYEMPEHEADPFGERGNVKGAYCVARLADGVMTSTMSLEEIAKVQNSSKAKNGPWASWWEEMAKKTMIKRASKSWPQTENRERWDRAVEVINEHEGLAYTIEEEAKYKTLLTSGDDLDFFLFVCFDIDEEKVNALFNCFPKGQKTAMKNKHREKSSEGGKKWRAILDEIMLSLDEDGSVALEIYNEIGRYDEIYAQLSVERQQVFRDLVNNQAP